MEKYILALDQGTTSSRAILFDRGGMPVARGQRPLTQIYPRPGWVEHDPEEIWLTQWAAVEDCLKGAGVGGDQIAAVGVTNQRETTVLWDRGTGHPVANAVSWQCRRTADECARLREMGVEDQVRRQTGLVLDPYFSATKVAWLLDHVPHLRARAEAGGIAFGTVDSWLVYKLTGGRRHVTDFSNASRTLLFNIHSLDWAPDLLELFRVPRALCPQVVDSTAIVGRTQAELFGRELPIAGIIGDQQAALYGHGCHKPGEAKCTYGTGAFVLMNTGDMPVTSAHGLLTTIAWGERGRVQYALEGSIFAAGAVVQWLRDELKIVDQASETEALAQSVPDTGDVYFVPAFVGLGAPYWDSYARGTVIGLTRGTDRAHLTRAALESIAYQTRDVLDTMADAFRHRLKLLKADGAAIQNNFLAQFQADMLGCPLARASFSETTAWGAALLAGRAVGFYSDADTPRWSQTAGAVFEPKLDTGRRDHLYRRWKTAVSRAREWAEPD